MFGGIGMDDQDNSYLLEVGSRSDMVSLILLLVVVVALTISPPGPLGSRTAHV